jgi:predicted Zn-dependent peptidase
MKRIALIFMLAAGSIAGQALKLPPFEKRTLPNGATLILAPGSDVPLTTVRLVFRGGSEADPRGKAGVASLTANLLRRGTSSRSYEQISEQVDSLGTTLSGSVTPQSSVIVADFLSANTDASLAILEDVIARPSFPDAEVRKVLNESLDRAKSAKDNPGNAIGLYHEAFFFGPEHPYGQVPDEVTIARITRDDIAAYHKRMYVGKNLVAVVTGSFDPRVVGPKVAALAAALPAGEAYVWANPAQPKFGESRLLLVDKPDATQTYFHIAMPGIHRTHPDRAAMTLVNTLFGGRFTSMLNDALRVNSGLTYGARSVVDRDRLTGSIYISTYTRTEMTAKAIDMSLDLLKQLREKGISKEMLDSAKAYVKGSLPTQMLETSLQLADTLGDLELFGQNRGEVDDLFSRLDAVSVEEANRVARKFYTLENLQFLLIGNAAKIKADAAKYSPKFKIVSVTEPGFSVAF